MEEDNRIFNVIPKLILDQDNYFLTVPAIDELTSVVFNINGDGALEPDGLTTFFY